MNRAAVGKFFPTAALALCLLKAAECLRGLRVCGVVYGIACDAVYITLYGKAPYARKKLRAKDVLPNGGNYRPRTNPLTFRRYRIVIVYGSSRRIPSVKGVAGGLV